MKKVFVATAAAFILGVTVSFGAALWAFDMGYLAIVSTTQYAGVASPGTEGYRVGAVACDGTRFHMTNTDAVVITGKSERNGLAGGIAAFSHHDHGAYLIVGRLGGDMAHETADACARAGVEHGLDYINY